MNFLSFKIKFEPTFFQVFWRFAFSLPLLGKFVKIGTNFFYCFSGANPLFPKSHFSRTIRIIKNVIVIFAGVFAGMIMTSLFIADFGHGENIYTRTFAAIFLAGAGSLLLSYNFKRWFWGLIPVFFPLFVVFTSILKKITLETLLLLVPISSAVSAGFLGVWFSRRGLRNNFLMLFLLLVAVFIFLMWGK